MRLLKLYVLELIPANIFSVSEGEFINRPLKIENHVTRIRSEISCFWALDLFCCFCNRSCHWNFVPYIWCTERSSFLVLGQRLFSCNVLKKLVISEPSDIYVQGGGGLPFPPKVFHIFFLDNKTSTSLVPFWDKFSDGQLLWLWDMMS